MKRILRILFLAGMEVCATCNGQTVGSPQSSEYPGREWKKCAQPETLGWSVQKLAAAREYSQKIGSAAVVIVQGGIVVDEWGDTTKKFNIHSIRKSLLSSLYGIAIRDNKIRLTDTLQDLGIDDVEPRLTSSEKQAQVIDLLKARSGIFHPALYETSAMKNKPPRGSHPHGTFWLYSNWDFNALGTIYERAMNSSIFIQFKKEIADPIEMQDFVLDDTKYISGTESMHAAYPFRMTARDMARFGLLYLRKGEWRGKQIVPRSWVIESTTPYSDAGPKGGYGYLWWCAIDGRLFPSVNLAGAYVAWGIGGHYILMMPDIDTVVVHRFNTDADDDAPGITEQQFGMLVSLIRAAKQ
jgi:CubicO group peptidase (beta-lactamase class C family)